MTACQPTEATPDCQGPFRWDRSQAVALLEEALDPQAPSSLRCFEDVPYLTLRLPGGSWLYLGAGRCCALPVLRQVR